MAELLELRQLFSNDDLKNKVVAATIIKAYDLINTSVDASEKALAKEVLTNPDEWGRIVMMTVLAANESLTTTQISGASKTAIQNNVNAVLPKFAGLI